MPLKSVNSNLFSTKPSLTFGKKNIQIRWKKVLLYKSVVIMSSTNSPKSNTYSMNRTGLVTENLVTSEILKLHVNRFQRISKELLCDVKLGGCSVADSKCFIVH